MYKKFVELLQKNNTTAYQVSKATGVSQSTLSDWKTGRATPKADKLCKIAEYFGVTIDYLLDSDTTTENSVDIKNIILEQAAQIRQESKKTPDKLPEFTEALCKVTAMLIILSRKADEPT